MCAEQRTPIRSPLDRKTHAPTRQTPQDLDTLQQHHDARQDTTTTRHQSHGRLAIRYLDSYRPSGPASSTIKKSTRHPTAGRCGQSILSTRFFNHSCDPNTGWSPTDGPACTNGSIKDVFAKRHIGKGEELCISHGNFSTHESKAERQKVIQSWIG